MIGRLLRATGWTPTGNSSPFRVIPRDTRFVRATWSVGDDGFPVITYTVDGIDPALADRIARLIRGDRRQRKRGLRIMREAHLFTPSRPAAFVIGDEIDAYQPGDQ